jgi:subtilisin family serine protease
MGVATAFASATPAHAASGRYIVVLEKGYTASAEADRARSEGATVRNVYRHALNGYAATLPSALVDRLRASKRVKAVVADTKMEFFASQPSPPSYGIDRVDQRALPLSGSYEYNATGAGVDSYIIDTGVRLTHQDFGGRAVSGVDLIDGGTVEDCYGHGSHVAGTVGGTTYGVAKGTRIVAVRIGGCEASLSTSVAIQGIDWVTGNHQAGKPATANMSFGGGANTAMDTAVKNMIADGVVAVIAAGNGNAVGLSENACNTSPSRVPEALTVSSVDSTDTKVGYANTGTCVDIFAPGYNIVSASYQSDTGSATMGGTSMAAPHVAGGAALYLETNPGATPAQVSTAVINAATAGVVKSPGSGSPNRLLYTAGWTAGGGTPTPTPTPTATPTTTPSPTPTPTPTGDPDPATPTLTNGVAASGTSAASGGWKYFKIAVPAGKSKLDVVLDGPACGLFGCSTDIDLFVQKTTKPTLTAKACSGETGSSDEACTVTGPAATYYYVGVYTYSGSAGTGFTVRATYP